MSLHLTVGEAAPISPLNTGWVWLLSFASEIFFANTALSSMVFLYFFLWAPDMLPVGQPITCMGSWGYLAKDHTISQEQRILSRLWWLEIYRHSLFNRSRRESLYLTASSLTDLELPYFFKFCLCLHRAPSLCLFISPSYCIFGSLQSIICSICWCPESSQLPRCLSLTEGPSSYTMTSL